MKRYGVLEIRNGGEEDFGRGYVLYDSLTATIIDGVYYSDYGLSQVLELAQFYNTGQGIPPPDRAPKEAALGLMYTANDARKRKKGLAEG